MYSLFDTSDASNDLWKACNSVISTASLQHSTNTTPFNPADDPCIELFSPKSGIASQLKALRGLGSIGTNALGLESGFPAHDGFSPILQHDGSGLQEPSFLDVAPMYGFGTATDGGFQQDEHFASNLQQSFLTADQLPGTCATAALEDNPYQQGCSTPERIHLGLNSASGFEPCNPLQHMASNQYSGMVLHSPQPYINPCIDTLRTSASAPSSPAVGYAASNTLFVPGQQPPPPRRAGPLRQPPPPPPRAHPGSQVTSTSTPGTPQTPSSSSPMQGNFVPGFMTSPSHATAGLRRSYQHDMPAGVEALLPAGVMCPSMIANSPPAPGMASATARRSISGAQPANSFNPVVQDTFCSSGGSFSGEAAYSPMHSVVDQVATVMTSSTAAYLGPIAPVNTSSPGDRLAASSLRQVPDGPDTPTAPVAILVSRPHLAGSRLSRSSSGTGSFHSCDSGSLDTSMGGAPVGLSRLSSSAAGNLQAVARSSDAMMAGPTAGSPAAPQPVPPARPCNHANVPSSQLFYMEMHDPDCSTYCLGGNMEPHKMWFAVGVHRYACSSYLSPCCASHTSVVHHHQMPVWLQDSDGQHMQYTQNVSGAA